MSLEMFCTAVAYSCNVAKKGDKSSTGLTRTPSDEWVYRHGFLTGKELLLLGALVSHQLSLVANEKGWGVDSKLWSRKPIFFQTNLLTDGLQWARQALHVFPEKRERLTWAAQWMARKRGLHGQAVKKGWWCACCLALATTCLRACIFLIVYDLRACIQEPRHPSGVIIKRSVSRVVQKPNVFTCYIYITSAESASMATSAATACCQHPKPKTCLMEQPMQC